MHELYKSKVNGNNAVGSGGGVFAGSLDATNTLIIITGSTVAIVV
jgi:hypothetical protein